MSDSTAATNPETGTTAAGVTDPATAQTTNPASSPVSKGKGKATAADDSMDIDEEDEEDEDDDDDEEEEEDDEDETEDLKEIDPSAIISGGRSRRSRPQVDYSSAEAHAKAGLKPGEEEEED